ncbi:MAG: CPBP family glutamic-type intramembrane protease [Pseudomonadota bacterium]|nr:CPBP family glutamic-type intramembrane protease [Pseudomonadota bacterium]
MLTVLGVSLFKKNAFISKGGLKFWFFGLSVVAVVQVNHFVRAYDFYFTDTFLRGTATYFLRLFYNVQCSLSYLLIPLIFYFFSKKPLENFWGLSFKKPLLKPYALILIGVLPFLWLASTGSHFRAVYPLFLTGSPDILSRYSFLQAFFLFQFFYVVQFVMLEIFFRGFMVLKGKEFIGKYSVFLMVTLYVLIHLEAKPMMESVGSLFGGLVLGAIAYQTRQIWGGILVHVGIALAMELLALI